MTPDPALQGHLTLPLSLLALASAYGGHWAQIEANKAVER